MLKEFQFLHWHVVGCFFLPLASSSATQTVEQRAKRAGVVAYDYEADPRWSEYLSNVLLCQQSWVPPVLAAAPASPDKNLEQKIKDSGDKLHSPPSSIEQLLPLLDVGLVVEREHNVKE